MLDVPREDRAAAVGQLRRRYLGPLVVLAAKGDDGAALGHDHTVMLVTRLFSAKELVAALALRVPRPPAAMAPTAAPAVLAAPTAPASAAVTDLGPRGPMDPKAAARRAPLQPATAPGDGAIARAHRLLASITTGWQARRRLWVAGWFSMFALLTFTAAFTMAAQGRCGPGCNALGTKLLTAAEHRPQPVHSPHDFPAQGRRAVDGRA